MCRLSRSVFGGFWYYLLVLLTLCLRIGEASHPGPLSGCAETHSWCIGTTNPSGINGKAHSYAELPQGIWNISETQATQTVFSHFRRDLSWRTSSKARIFHGAYAGLRPNSDYAGTWTGVAQMAWCPMKPLNIVWNGLEFISGRAMMSSFHLGGLSILGACFYGPPTGPTYGSARALTEELLQIASHELILGSSGPRFIAGDLNCDSSDLPCFALWRQQGWLELQTIAEQRWGQSRQATSKGKQIRDQVWISPELQQWLTGVRVDDEIFADHAVLYGIFDIPSVPQWQYHWQQPAVLPWHLIDHGKLNQVQSSPHVWDSSDLTADFKRWSKSTERDIQQCHLDPLVLQKRYWGRGITTKASRRALTHTPVGCGRHGEIQPKSSFFCRLGQLWLRQLRRLQAYVQRSSSLSTSPALQADQCATWSAIRRAHGFHLGFEQWWMRRQFKHEGSPAIFPQFPPALALAKVLLADFEANYRQFESWQITQRKRIIQTRHQEHNRLLFKQMRGDQQLPLEHLVQKQEATIVRVQSPDVVQVSSPMKWHAEMTWSLQKTPVEVERIDDLHLQIETDLLLVPGQTLSSRLLLTTFDDIQHELSDLWTPIWMKHQGLAASHWDRIIAFMLHHVPARPVIPVKWTAPSLASLCSTYKKKSARGPDAWARQDIDMLPLCRKADLCALFETVQNGAWWPEQLLHAFICSVRKEPLAETAAQYRPIVLVSFLYRLWACGITRQTLPKIAQTAPNLVFGFVPGRRATDTWFLIQACVEGSALADETLTGFNADLIKCFNCLPRAPLQQLLLHLGLDPGASRAWKQALIQLRRHFKLLGSVGEGFASTTGYPEGDPLSCLAMIGFNIALATYLKVYAPQIAAPAFVDNLQLLASSVGTLHHGVGVLSTFLEAWDLKLDPRKSFAWAMSTHDRKFLRLLQYQVLYSAKDLGAQMCYSKLSRSQVAQQRLESVQPLWQILRRSSAPRWNKLLTIRTLIWPKALHGAPNRMVPQTTLKSLRSHAMTALGWNRGGANPIVRWAMMQQPLNDPEFFQLWDSLLTSWRMFRAFDIVRQLWISFVRALHVPGQGPLHVVMQVCDTLGWFLDEDLQMWIHGQPWSFIDMSAAELRLFAVEDWRQTLCARLSHRMDFQGLPTIDTRASFSFNSKDIAQVELIATLQDGTFYTSSQKAKFDPQFTGFCSRCDVEDTLEHRAIHCPEYAAIRQHFPRQVRQWPTKPTSFTHHGLLPRNPHLWTYWISLANLPDLREAFFRSPVDSGIQCLFVDGSCTEPREPFLSLASWSMVAMEPKTILAGGPLHGVLQSVDRAEVCALHSAAIWALQSPQPTVAFSDSTYALHGFSYLWAHRFVPSHWKNEDLWSQVLNTLLQLAPNHFVWRKVAAHCNLDEAWDPCEEFLYAGNALADETAKRFNLQRSADFHECYTALRAHDQQAKYQGRSQLAFLLALAQKDLSIPSSSSTDPEEIPLSALCNEGQPNMANLAAQLLDGHLSGSFPDTFPLSYVQTLTEWVAGIDITASICRPVTYLELMTGFFLTTNTSFPVPIERSGSCCYVFRDEVVSGGLVRQTAAALILGFRKALDLIFATLAVSVTRTESNRPAAGVIRNLSGIVVGWPSDLASQVDCFLLDWVGSRPVRRACDLARPW